MIQDQIFKMRKPFKMDYVSFVDVLPIIKDKDENKNKSYPDLQTMKDHCMQESTYSKSKVRDGVKVTSSNIQPTLPPEKSWYSF
mgnify:CR=1 FL=1